VCVAFGTRTRKKGPKGPKGPFRAEEGTIPFLGGADVFKVIISQICPNKLQRIENNMMPSFILLLFGTPLLHAITYPAGITNCGVQNWISSPPQRAVTLNQGATEMLLGLNLSRTFEICYAFF
jgi:hypothetical protein